MPHIHLFLSKYDDYLGGGQAIRATPDVASFIAHEQFVSFLWWLLSLSKYRLRLLFPNGAPAPLVSLLSLPLWRSRLVRFYAATF